MSERVEGDRLVVTGKSSGSQFPRKQEAMAQRYEADGTTAEGPFFIEGSIYGRDLRFRGPGAVLGPVLGRGDITLEPSEGQAPQRFLGGLHSSGNIGSAPRKGGFRASLLASVDNVGTVVRGDVIADQISLIDTVVFGCVRGRRVKLSRCIVFGNVIATEAAVIGSSTILGYEAGQEVRFEGPCCLVFPNGTSVEAPAFVPAVDEAGFELPCSVMFLPALLALGSTSLGYCPRPDAGVTWASDSWRPTAESLLGNDESVIAASLHPVDWVKHSVETEVRKLRGKEIFTELVFSDRYILSIAGRALDFDAIVPALRHATWMLKTAIEFDHYSPVNQARTITAWAERCRPDELTLLHFATSRERPATKPRRGAHATVEG